VATSKQKMRRGRFSLIIGSFVAAVAFGAVAWADNVQVNDIAVDGITGVRTLEVTTGTGAVSSANFSYKITANSGDGQTGCNAADASPATISLGGLPTTGVSVVADTDLVFTACGVAKGLHLSVDAATAAGSYPITVSVSDSGPGTYNTNPGAFTLHIVDGTPPNISYAITDGAGGSATLGDNGWYTSNVHVDWTVSEPNSASSLTIPSGKCVDTLINADTTGTTLECSASSDGGTAPNQSVTIKRDATNPTVSISSPADGASVSTATVNVTGSASDATSDIASVKVNGSSATYDAATDTWSVTGVALTCGSNTITAEAKDNAGHTSQASHSVTRVCNQPPTVDAAIAGDASANEGSQKTYSIGATDPDGDTLTYAWSITAGSSFASISSGASTSSVTVDFTDGPSSPDVTLQVVVGDGHAGHDVTRTKTVHVANVAPQVSLTSPPTSATEGQTKTYNYTVFDPGADTYSVDSGYPTCGTGGTLLAGSSIGGSSGSQTGSFQCSFPDGPANPTVAISITDSDLDTGSASQPVLVNNMEPTIGTLNLSGNTGTACLSGNTVNLTFSFSDPAGSYDTYTGSIDWGDSNATAFGSSFNVNESHAYAPGTYTIKVNVHDEDGGVAAEKQGSVSRLYNTGAGILQPINADGTSNFKLGSTIPVKIKVLDCLGNSVGTLAPKVSLKFVSAGNGSVNEVLVDSVPDNGDNMRYDSSALQYIYNLSTKRSTLINPAGAPLELGRYTVTVSDTSFAPRSQSFDILK
jgi:hypothetical protein